MSHVLSHIFLSLSFYLWEISHPRRNETPQLDLSEDAEASVSSHAVHQIWYADDACASGSLQNLRQWWNDLGPDYGYFINASKCWLLLKDSATADANLFDGTGVNVCSDRQWYLGCGIGISDFVNNFVSEQVQSWCDELSLLNDISRSQPHAVFSSYVRGFASKWAFLCQTTRNISHLFESLINTTFLPVLTEQPQCNELLRELLSLPVREGGLGIVEPSKAAESQYANSLLITTPLVSILTGNSSATVLDVHDQML